MNIPDRWNPRIWLRHGRNRWIAWLKRATPAEAAEAEARWQEVIKRHHERYWSLPPHLREIVRNANAKSCRARQRRMENQPQASHKSSQTASSEDNPPPSAQEGMPQNPQ